MKSSSCVHAAALAAAVSLWASPAMAQITSLSQLSDAQEAELYCVHGELRDAGEGFYAVIDTLLYGGQPGADAEATLHYAIDTCVAEYKWDARKEEIGTLAGLASAAVDFLIEELYADGGTDAHMDAIDRAVVKLPNEEINRFIAEDWIDDEAFNTRLDTLLVAEKFPADDDYHLETARFIIEAHVGQTLATWEWVGTYINKQ